MGLCFSVQKPEERPLQRFANLNDVYVQNGVIRMTITRIVKVRNQGTVDPNKPSTYKDTIDHALLEFYTFNSRRIIADIKTVSTAFRDFSVGKFCNDAVEGFDNHKFADQLKATADMLDVLASTTPYTEGHDCTSYVHMGAYIASVREWTCDVTSTVDRWFESIHNKLMSTVLTLDDMATEYRTAVGVSAVSRASKMIPLVYIGEQQNGNLL